MGYETISVSCEGSGGVITISRPEALTARCLKLLTELSAALDSIEGVERIRALVITGSEKAFSAGADIKEMADMTAVEMAKTEHFFPLWEKVGGYPKPIVGALSGYVLGGGLELAMSLDVLVASETTQFGQAEIDIGVMPGGGGTQRLTGGVGRSRGMERILTG